MPQLEPARATLSEQDVAPDSQTGDGDVGTATSPPRDLTMIRRWAYLGWAAVVVLRVAILGWSFDLLQLLILICLGLVATSIGRRSVLLVLRDWLPFALLLGAYDLSRRAALVIGMPTQWHLAVDADKWMFFGQVPTVWLQSHLKSVDVPWWEVLVSTVYMSYFIIPIGVATILWLRNRQAWRRYVVRFVVISFAALIGYILVPAAPPWAAARCTAEQVADHPSSPPCMFDSPADAPNGGLLGVVDPHHPGAAPYVERISTRGWDETHLTAATTAVESGQAGSNLVAAIPSLHAGLTMMVALFVWPLVRRRWWAVWAAYPLIMGFALVYTGEHYVLDVLLGWAMAAAVIVGCAAVERWWARRGATTTSVLSPPNRAEPDRILEHVGHPDLGDRQPVHSERLHHRPPAS
ncbi:phosphatase PAP2 family protein [Tomitella biformata]|uniref:phosphatase PAP2 family protein n=1 Tax=Tomitella biformata TaxID=630403 RepID=UPI0004659014|nr:phosphatase PAP2 family protein [Tomitella biformata]